MSIPSSKKLQTEEASAETSSAFKTPSQFAKKTQEEPDALQIRVVKCCNDFVAILQSKIETSIALADEESAYINEGIVVGVGPGISDNAGGRLQPGVEVGDSVMFGHRNVAGLVDSDKPPYAGKRVVIVSERNVICKLPEKLEFDIIE